MNVYASAGKVLYNDADTHPTTDNRLGAAMALATAVAKVKTISACSYYSVIERQSNSQL